MMTVDADNEPIAVDEGFAVRDAASANWVVRKIVEARAYAARSKAWADAEQRRAQREEDFLLRRFGAELEQWARQQIARQRDRRQSVNLPAGRIGFRTEPTKLAVMDERQLLNWCRQNLSSAICTIESVAKTPLMEHLKATGECPTGTELMGGGHKFYISGRNPKFLEGVGHDATEEEAG
jgi:hypothetical protein